MASGVAAYVVGTALVAVGCGVAVAVGKAAGVEVAGVCGVVAAADVSASCGSSWSYRCCGFSCRKRWLARYCW